jgi:hypothetical protein
MEAAAPGGLTRRSTALSRVPLPALASGLALLLAIGQPLLAQLVGVLVWDQCYCRGGVDTWGVASTTLVWFSAVAVSGGLLAARRFTGQRAPVTRGEYLGAIIPPVLGALLATPVIAALARQASVDGVDHPAIEASLSVPIGAVLGAAVAAGALASPAVARGLAASWVWTWLLVLFAALLVALVPTAGTQPLGGVELWPGEHTSGTRLFRIVAIALVLLGAAAVGGLVSWASVRRGSRVAVAVLAGSVGPLLVVAAYRSRPDALVDGNASWAWVAVLALLTSVLGGGIGAALAVARQAREAG